MAEKTLTLQGELCIKEIGYCPEAITIDGQHLDQAIREFCDDQSYDAHLGDVCLTIEWIER